MRVVLEIVQGGHLDAIQGSEGVQGVAWRSFQGSEGGGRPGVGGVCPGCGVRLGVKGLGLQSGLFLDPAAKLCDTRVHARLVPTSAAFAPADHARLEDTPTVLCDGQRPTRVPLQGQRLKVMLLRDNTCDVKQQ